MNKEVKLNITPEELSALVAVEIAGWQTGLFSGGENQKRKNGMAFPNFFSKKEERAWWHDSHPINKGVYASPPKFAESVDAVLPLIEKFGTWSRGTTGSITIYKEVVSPAWPHKDWPNDPKEEWMILEPVATISDEMAKPLARGFCFVLLKANGFKLVGV